MKPGHRVVTVDGDILTLDKNGIVIKRVESIKHKQARVHFRQFDIEKSGHKVPERVCILGPGVNAANEDAYKKITADFIIAINCAIVIPDADCINWPSDKFISGWFLAGYDVGAIEWYQEKFRDINIKAARYFSVSTCVSGVDIPPQWDASIDLHTYIFGEKRLFKPSYTPLGIAAYVMAFCGAKYIELCGFDLAGNEYYNHTHRGEAASFHPAYIHSLEQCLVALIKSGVEIVTLNSIALKCLSK